MTAIELHVLLAHGRQLCSGHLEAAVASDDPDLVLGARASWAPIAAGSAKPIVPSPPEVTSERGRS